MNEPTMLICDGKTYAGIEVYDNDVPYLKLGDWCSPRRLLVEAAEAAKNEDGAWAITAYITKNYLRMADEACHEGCSVRSHEGGVWTASLCSKIGCGISARQAIEQLAELILLGVVCGQTGMC